MVRSATVGHWFDISIMYIHFFSFYVQERKALAATYADIHRFVRISGVETRLGQIESYGNSID